MMVAEAGETKDIIAHAALIHTRFKQIHPFSYGNGLIGRLLMDAMLLQANFPPAVIRPERKRFYDSSLRRAQEDGDTVHFQDLLCDSVLEGWATLER